MKETLHLVTEAERKLASQLWTTALLPIGSDERHLVSAFIAHPRARVTDEQSGLLALLAARLKVSA